MPPVVGMTVKMADGGCRPVDCSAAGALIYFTTMAKAALGGGRKMEEPNCRKSMLHMVSTADVLNKKPLQKQYTFILFSLKKCCHAHFQPAVADYHGYNALFGRLAYGHHRPER
jgi:hypothetical protein